MNKVKPISFSDDFKEIVKGNYFVDKSLFIERYTHPGTSIYIVTRPAGFGKSVNLSMLKTFLEISDEDTSVYFRDLKIWGRGEKVTSAQGKFPVIYLRLKEAACPTYADTVKKIAEAVSKEFARHAELKDSPAKNESVYGDYDKISAGTAEPLSYNVSTAALCQMLKAHYGEKPYILVDDYDAPLAAGEKYGYYDRIWSFLRDLYYPPLFNPGAKATILVGEEFYKLGIPFDSFHNASVNELVYSSGGADFGFTENETRALLKAYGMTDKYEEVISWYGRCLGGSETELCSSLSVMKYVSQNCTVGRYRDILSDTSITEDLLCGHYWAVMEKFSALVSRKDQLEFGTGRLPAFNISQNGRLESSLLTKGYLTRVPFDHSISYYSTAIPNKEALLILCDGLSSFFWGSDTAYVRKAVSGGSVSEIHDIFSRMAEKLSVYDSSLTPIWYDVVTALSLVLSDVYSITTDSVNGKKPTSVILSPKTTGDGLRNMVFAISVCDASVSLKKAAKAAKRQKSGDGNGDCVVYGVAVCGKDVYVV